MDLILSLLDSTLQLIMNLVEIAIHLDKHMTAIVAQYGGWTHLILFAIVFFETGIVVTPFLPGDSLLFVAGTLAALGALDLSTVLALLFTAAVAGDTLNYSIGKWAGPEIFHKETGRFLNKKHLVRAHDFYERHGGKAIVLARFIPIVRTFAPFVAGIGRMNYRHFIGYNLFGGLLWVLSLTFAGYWFGNIPAVKSRFSLVVAAIIVISVMPVAFELAKVWLAKKPAAPEN